MRHASTLDVGLDVHQESIAVAYAPAERGAAVAFLGPIGTRQCDLDTRLRQRQSTSQQLVFVDEAGPCGSWLDRDRRKQGDDGWVVAPSLMPQKAGERVNTDRREARPLARLLRSGALTPVSVPTADADASRDLCRARDDALRALNAAQVRLKACFRRHDLRSTGRATWGPAHRRWR